MRSKADETFVTVETLIYPLQVSHVLLLISYLFFISNTERSVSFRLGCNDLCSHLNL